MSIYYSSQEVPYSVRKTASHVENKKMNHSNVVSSSSLCGNFILTMSELIV